MCIEHSYILDTLHTLGIVLYFVVFHHQYIEEEGLEGSKGGILYCNLLIFCLYLLRICTFYVL